MKAKKIIVFLIVIVALGIGLYLFQKNKQEKELIAHNTQKFQKMIEAAEQSAPVGLPVMASAINKYHQIKGHYPETLLKLYPEFISDKSFILALNCNYYPENGSYLIKRNIKGQKMFASMGPDLKLKTGRIDSAAQPETVVSLNKPDSEKTAKAVALKSVNNGFDINKDTKFIEAVKKASLADIKNDLKDLKKEDERNNNIYEASVKIVKKELNKNEQYLLSFNSGRFYIWKTKDGIIGFSDTQYPDEKQLAIYKDQSWIEYDDLSQKTIIKK